MLIKHPKLTLILIAVLIAIPSAAAGCFAASYMKVRGDYKLALEKAETIYDKDRANAVHALVVEHDSTQSKLSGITSNQTVLKDDVREVLEEVQDISDVLRKDD